MGLFLRPNRDRHITWAGPRFLDCSGGFAEPSPLVGHVTNAEFHLPGTRERRSDWIAAPTTPARSWAELIETIQGGLAILDDNWQLGLVTERFLSVLGEPENLTGEDLRDLLPALAIDDPRDFQAQVERGVRVEFEQQFVTDDGTRSWFRTTIVPCSDLGEPFTAVVFSKNISETSRTLAQLRDASLRLTEIERELQHRVGRDVHDGPIQLLAALVFRLGISTADRAAELQSVVSEVAATLRRVIEEFVPEASDERASVIGQWLSPLLAGSKTAMSINDLRSAPSGLPEAQAVFLMIYQATRGMRDTNSPRTFAVELTDERGGERIIARAPSARPAELSGRRAAQFRATVHHVHAFGGTLETWLTSDDVRVLSMWIPKQTGRVDRMHRPTPASNMTVAPLLPATDEEPRAQLPPLQDSAWRQLVMHAPERMVEFDHQMRVSLANETQEDTVAVDRNSLIGFSPGELFSHESLSHLDEVFGQLDDGHLVDTNWMRENAHGDTRLIHLTMSPRLDDTGAWQGLFLVTEDLTDVELLNQVYETALADLALARRSAVKASVQRLEEPLNDCVKLIDQLRTFEAASSRGVAIGNILDELAESLERVGQATRALSAPDPVIGNLEAALRRSLGGLLVGRTLSVMNTAAFPVDSATSAVLFQIAREAVHNAVVHGGATSVAITQSRSGAGMRFDIHDNGTGLDPERRATRPGHLGVRVMQERAAEHGGSCKVENHPDGGTLVNVWLPTAAS